MGLFVWLLAAATWALQLVTRRDRALGIGLAAVLLALFVHSLLYAGLLEDPLVWGALGLAAAVLAVAPAPEEAEVEADTARPPSTPRLLAH